MLTKKSLRSKILSVLRKQKEESRLKKSKIIKDRLFRLAVFKKAKKAMFYVTFDGEVDTKEMIIEAQKKGKTVVIPVCDRNKRIIVPCKIGKEEKLKRGCYNVPEPLIKKRVALKDLDLVVVPGVAFDKRGNRLGRGKGYYDCFLKGLPKHCVSIGLAFDFQVLPCLPVAAHDVCVDKLLFA